MIALLAACAIAPVRSQVYLETDQARRIRIEKEERERTDRVFKELEAQSRAREAREAIQNSVMRVALVRASFSGAPSIGAGVLVGRDGQRLYLVTADHVVRRGSAAAAAVAVSFKSAPGETRPAEILPLRDPDLDLAVLAVDARRPFDIDMCTDGFFVKLDKALERGLGVLPVGHPNGELWFLPVTQDAMVGVRGGELSFQSTVLAPGHSGGALMAADGDWAGLVTADAAPLGRAITAETVVRRLLQWQVPVMTENAPFRRLVAAIESRDIAALQRQLEICDPNEWGPKWGRDHSVSLPLELAIDGRNARVVAALLKAGAKPDVRISLYGTLLHKAAVRGTWQITELLLAAGADPNVAEADGTTPLMRAAAGNRIETARRLLDAGANVNARSKKGKTALGLTEGHPEMRELLLQRGAVTPPPPTPPNP